MTTEREIRIHCARIYLAEARHRRAIPGQRAWCFCLLQMAANQRRRAAEVREPIQMNLI